MKRGIAGEKKVSESACLAHRKLKKLFEGAEIDSRD